MGDVDLLRLIRDDQIEMRGDVKKLMTDVAELKAERNGGDVKRLIVEVAELQASRAEGRRLGQRARDFVIASGGAISAMAATFGVAHIIK